MFHRQKILLALIEAFDGRLNSLDLQKYLFLFSEKCQKEKSYEFVPYRFGCFSFQSYADRRNLTDAGYLAEGEDWQLKQRGFLKDLSEDDAKKILTFKKDYENISGEALVREVYRHYPYYATKSEIAVRLMSTAELANIEKAKPTEESHQFYTIGYEEVSFENYLNRLIQNNVRLLCDVRKNPLSRKYGFSKKTLSDTLKKLNIDYIHIPELGIISEKRQKLNSQADYNQLFDEYEKTTLKNNATSLQNIMALMKKYKRVAITCFEAEQCMCHRGRVAAALSKLPGWDYSIQHL